jgi:AcrR family transcriptional regulator
VKESPARGERRKNVIAEAALELFIERGFGPVTIDDVAAEIGASKQTIYRFFGDRTGLIAFCLELELDRVIAPLHTVATGPGPAESKLESVALEFQRLVFADRCLRIYRYVLGEVNSQPQFGHAFTALVTDRVVPLVSTILAEARLLDPHAADVATDVFLGTLQGKEFNRALAGAKPREERLSELRAAAILGLPAPV